MSVRERRSVVDPEERMSAEHLQIVRAAIDGRLRGQATDLRLLNRYPDPKGALRKVIALGRLAAWPHLGKVEVPDPEARASALGLAESVDELNEYEGIVERYEQAMVEHDATRALVAALSDGSGPGEDRREPEDAGGT